MPESRSRNSRRLLFAAGRKLFPLLMAAIFLVAPAYESRPSSLNWLPGRSSALGESEPQYITSANDQAKMIIIPEGAFTYGVNPTEFKSLLKSLRADASMFIKELPKQSKHLTSFYIDQYEVTNAQYELFLKATGHREPRYWSYPQLNGHRQPVVGVSYADAEAYAGWAGKRLPSEEEWEKAARGTDGRTWPWGNDKDETRYNGWTKANYAPLNVGSFPKGDSPYGVSDMAGNVWEMTTGTLPRGGKVIRGGSFANRAAEVRVTRRWGAPSEDDRGAMWLGFRCVKD